MSIYQTAGAPPCIRSPQHPNLDYPSLSSLTTSAYSATKSFDEEANMVGSARDPSSRPKHFRNLYEEFIFVFTVMMATSSTTFLQGVIIINTSTIGRGLHMTAAQVTWIAAAIGLASGSFMLFFGKTADLFGGKIQLLVGMGFLSLFALITAYAPNAISMNVLCGFLGLGTAAISPPAIGTLLATYPEGRRRNKAAGALGCGNPVGFILGSISSGISTKLFGWRASFVFIAIFFLIMTLLAFWTVPSMPRSGNIQAGIRQFDYLGAVLTVVGLALFTAALTEGPETGWKTAKVVFLLILGLGCLFGFAIWEHFYTYPLLNPIIWKNANFTLCFLCVLFGYMSFITNQFWISLYMQEVQDFSSLHIAVRLLPQALAGILWSFVCQKLVHQISGTVLMGIGALAYVIGAMLLIFIKEDTSYWKFLFPSLIVTVLGADFQFIVSNLYVTKQMPAQSSLAAGVLQMAGRVSVSIGLSITAAIHGSISHSPAGTADRTLPYERALLCSLLFAVVGLCVVPFMRIAKQGDKARDSEPNTAVSEEDRPKMGGEYNDGVSADSQIRVVRGALAASYLPRWSWEEERELKMEREGTRNHEPPVVYEVCMKCLQERRVTLSGGQIGSWRL